jgi:hypothetical protein
MRLQPIFFNLWQLLVTGFRLKISEKMVECSVAHETRSS